MEMVTTSCNIPPAKLLLSQQTHRGRYSRNLRHGFVTDPTELMFSLPLEDLLCPADQLAEQILTQFEQQT
jgi:hypothetical protein